MIEQERDTDHKSSNESEHVCRCLAMVMHYEEIQQIAEVITKIVGEQTKTAQSHEVK